MLMLLSQGSAPGPSPPGPSQSASSRRLSQNPQAVAARKRRAEKRKESERQPTSPQVNHKLGVNVRWLDWEEHRLAFFLRDEERKTHGDGPIDFDALERRFNQGLTEAEQRTKNQITGKVRQWRELEDDGRKTKATKTRWSKWQVERLTEIATATPKRDDQLQDIKEIVNRYNDGLPEADHRNRNQIERKLRYMSNPRGPAGAETDGPDDPAEGAVA